MRANTLCNLLSTFLVKWHDFAPSERSTVITRMMIKSCHTYQMYAIAASIPKTSLPVQALWQLIWHVHILLMRVSIIARSQENSMVIEFWSSLSSEGLLGDDSPSLNQMLVYIQYIYTVNGREETMGMDLDCWTTASQPIFDQVLKHCTQALNGSSPHQAFSVKLSEYTWLVGGNA